MKFLETIGKNCTKTAAKVGFALKKASPELMLVAGIAAVVGGTVMAIVNAPKAEEAIDSFHDDINAIHEAAEENEECYDIKLQKKDTAVAYRRMIVGVVKAYAPTFILETVGIGFLIGSHTIMKQRYASIAAAYAALDKSYKNYRKNVVERFGPDVDQELKYGIKTITVNETTEDGTEVQKEVQVVDDALNPYTRIFDANNTGWEKNPYYTLSNLKRLQESVNDLLHERGVVSLNQVLGMLGYPPVKEGVYMGWIDKKDEIVNIDFGIRNVNRPATQDFLNGIEDVVMLDFSEGIVNILDDFKLIRK